MHDSRSTWNIGSGLMGTAIYSVKARVGIVNQSNLSCLHLTLVVAASSAPLTLPASLLAAITRGIAGNHYSRFTTVKLCLYHVPPFTLFIPIIVHCLALTLSAESAIILQRPQRPLPSHFVRVLRSAACFARLQPTIRSQLEQ